MRRGEDLHYVADTHIANLLELLIKGGLRHALCVFRHTQAETDRADHHGGVLLVMGDVNPNP